MIQGTSVTSLTIPSTVTASGASYSGYPYYGYDGALAGCDTLKNVTFAQGTTKIPDNICASASQTSYIETISIPDSVLEIGSNAFFNCVNLTGGIDIPRSTKDVGSGAFQNCKSITSVQTHHNDTKEWVGSSQVAWAGTIHDSAFSGCTSLNSVELAGSIKTLGDRVFDGCTSLATLTLPEGVTSLGIYCLGE